jgi:hypothetical protein
MTRKTFTLLLLATVFAASCNSSTSREPSATSSATEQANTSKSVPKAPLQPGLTEAEANEVAKPSTPIEYQLAVMNAGHLIPKDDPTVQEFRNLLRTLKKETGYSFADIRQKNMGAVKMARERTGTPIELLDFMKVSLTLVKRFPKMDYNQILAGMVVNSELWG